MVMSFGISLLLILALMTEVCHDARVPRCFATLGGLPFLTMSTSSSDVIMEGSSVNLTCINSLNPFQNQTWFKEGKYVGSGKIYSITNISSNHSGEYKCMSGNKLSDGVILNVMYAPKNMLVSISPSGEIVEGDPVTLTCSSEANPPVQNYSWFKDNQTPPVGHGWNFSISSFNSSHSGWFSCVAQNKYGSQTSAAVLVTVKDFQGSALYTVSGIVGGCGAMFLIIIFIIITILFIKKRRRDGRANIKQNQMAEASEDTYTALNPAFRTSDNIYSTI